ncbi:MAG TPA: S8 family serine peptidase, partial [Spirochaetota bacterium]|nr:S8 family serine peptidase [Spirochaetota bacterium]
VKRISLLLFTTSMLFSTSLMAESGMMSHADDRIIVRYRSSAQGAAAAARHGSRVIRQFSQTGITVQSLKSGESVSSGIARLRRDPSVLYAEPDYVLEAVSTPNDPDYNSLWGLTQIHCPEAWDYTSGSREVIVAVVDTGVDYTHPDLAANIWTNTGEIPDNGIDDDGNGYVDDIHGYNFFSYNNNPFDDNGHGTHCAGTIGAAGDNGTGVIGVSPSVSIMALKFLSAGGTGYTSDAIKCIAYAVANGARVLSCSWGGGYYSEALFDAIESARSQGVTVVIAAGNNGTNNDAAPFYPASYSSENIISVGASTPGDINAYFSNYGMESVDVFAPGTGILSTFPGGGYRYLDGTSMAAPHVTGAVAMYLASDSEITPASLRNIVMSSSDKIDAFAGKCVSGGRLNTAKLVIESCPSPNLDISAVNISGGDGDRFPECGETIEVSITIKNTGETLRSATGTLRSGNSLISVLSGTSLYPDTLPGGTSVNTTKYKVHINDFNDNFRESGLVLEIHSSFTGKKELLRVPLYAGSRCDILLVDDDNGSSTDTNINDSLSRLGYNVFRWDIQKAGIPPLESINTSLVIWNTGNATGVPLSPEETAKMSNYLSLNGSLVIAGDEWVDMLPEDVFVRDRLLVSLDEADADPVQQNGINMFQGNSFVLPSIALHRDRLSPRSGGVLLAADQGQTASGTMVCVPTAVDSGPSLSAAFDISYLENSSRDRLIQLISALMLRPEPVSVTPRDRAIDISWRHAPGSSSTEYNISSSGVPGITAVTTEQHATITGLENGRLYNIRLRAVNNSLPASMWCRTITVSPSASGGGSVQPVTGFVSVPDVNGLTISWRPSIDSRVSGYMIEIWKNGTFTGYTMSETPDIRLSSEFTGTSSVGEIVVYPVCANGSHGIPARFSWSYSDIFPPDEVYNIQVTEDGYGRLRITWEPPGNEDIAGHIVDIKYRSGDFGGPVDTGIARTALIENISEGEVTYIRVRSRDNSGNISAGVVVQHGQESRGDSIKYCGCGIPAESDGYSEAGIGWTAMALVFNFLIIGLGVLVELLRRICTGRRSGI